MSEGWDDESFEHEEFRKMFQMMGSDPEMLDTMRQVGAKANAQAAAHNRRREIFTKLVYLMVHYCEWSVPPEQRLLHILMVVNNSYAVPLPDTEADVLALAIQFIKWYQGTIPCPAWMPEVWRTAGSSTIWTFPMLPAQGAD